MKRYLHYMVMEPKAETIKYVIEEIGNDKYTKGRVKVLNSDNRVFDLGMLKGDYTKEHIIALYAQKCMNFARFTPEATNYIQDNYKANMGLKMRKINIYDSYTFDITWVNEHCKTIGEEQDGDINTEKETDVL